MFHAKHTLSLALKILILLCFLPVVSWAGIVVANGLSHAHQINVGEVQKGRIEIQNANGTRDVRIYQRDYRFLNTGEAFYDEPGTLERSNASWIDINPTYITIEPGQTTFVNYELRVPQNDKLSGTYWSVIMVEEVAPLNTNVIEKGVTINTLIRYAVQISATIGSTGKKELNFTNIELKKAGEDGAKMFVLDVENNGDCLLRPGLSVELFDEAGTSIGVFSAPKKTTYPGTSVRFEIDLSAVNPGTYQAMVLADCSEEDVFGINVAVEIKND